MANQDVSNERKKELQQMDPFQENLLKAMAYAKNYRKQLGLILGAVIVVVLVFYGIMASFQRAESKASDLLAQTVDRYHLQLEQEKKTPVQAYEAVKDDFRTLLDEYANTSAGEMARVKFARICFDANVYDQAYTLYKDAIGIFKHETGMQNFLLSSLGHVCLAKGDMAKARSYFLELEKADSDLMKDDARFALASLYTAENDREKSLKMYEKLVADSGNPVYKAIAESKIAAAGIAQ